MPVQPHTRTRAPYLTASAGWRWPRVDSADDAAERLEHSARDGARSVSVQA